MSFSLRQWLEAANDRMSGMDVPHANDATALHEKNAAEKKRQEDERRVRLQQRANERARAECHQKIWNAIRAKPYSLPIKCAPMEPHRYHVGSEGVRPHLGEKFVDELKSKNYVVEQVVQEEISTFDRCYKERDAFTLVKFK